MELLANTDSNKGFTLVEFMIALVIMTVGLLGLLQTVNFAIHHNINNQLRQESAMLADECMNLEKAKPFDRISTMSSMPTPVADALEPTKYVRRSATDRVINGAFRNYSVIKTNTVTTTLTKTVDIRVGWRYKQDRFNHSISSLVSSSQ